MEEDGTANARIFIAANVTVNDTFFPMIRKSTETDSSFVPYENSCPISGWTGIKIVRTGKICLMEVSCRAGSAQSTESLTAWQVVFELMKKYS